MGIHEGPSSSSWSVAFVSKAVAAQSRWSIALDLLSAKILVWIARRGRSSELTPEAHLYFFDRYQRLAALYHARGRTAKAKAFQAKANEHYRPGQDDGPPYAAAMAMPRPRRMLQTDAVSRTNLHGPDDAA